MKIISVVGARPNFMKMAPVHKAFKKYKLQNPTADVHHLVTHTGQHYDEKMSKVFFEDLELPKPDYYLGVGSGTHAEQTARIMIEFEKVLLQEKPDLIVVYGDVNSTVACALTAVKLNIKVAHVEAGLRSGDRTMPEEINRLLTDAISEYLLVSEPSGIENLKKEGVPAEKVFFVGNTMIDSLAAYLPKAKMPVITNELVFEDALDSSLQENDDPDKYILVTLHRPSNVDSEAFARKLADSFNSLAENIKIIFPIHPRTRKNFETWNILEKLSPNVILLEPVPYIEFISLVKHCTLVFTDSGGIQEESTWLGVPCITLRENTERPVTVTEGTNILIGTDIDKAILETRNILAGNIKKGRTPDLWDGKAAERIVDILVSRV